MEAYNKLQILMWLSLVEAGYFANIDLKAPENLSTKLEVLFLSGHVKTSLTKALPAANISLSFGTLMILRHHKDQSFLYVCNPGNNQSLMMHLRLQRPFNKQQDPDLHYSSLIHLLLFKYMWEFNFHKLNFNKESLLAQLPAPSFNLCVTPSGSRTCPVMLNHFE